ncbi:MAG: glycyl-radical enzyme activating protein [Clostridia bacterium]|nr:glycyl-radical enzyme activating protein [Clostridia bacterium]
MRRSHTDRWRSILRRRQRPGMGNVSEELQFKREGKRLADIETTAQLVADPGTAETDMDRDELAVSGLVTNIQKYSTEDGPGIRTTVFLKGCPLRCLWCHNPEGQETRPELIYYQVRCIGCGACAEVCPQKAITPDPATGFSPDRRRCTGCGTCADACPAKARKLMGSRLTVAALLAEVEKDVIFYVQSGGGITLSGGEPTMQPDFCQALLFSARKRGIPTALDTCGWVSWSTLKEMLPAVDLVLFDLKQIDPELHRKQVGASLEPILANLQRLDAAGKAIYIRTPVVPGYTDQAENIAAIARFLRPLEQVQVWDLLPFHQLGEAKYRQLGKKYALANLKPPTTETMERLAAIARSELGQSAGRIQVNVGVS